MAIKKPTSKRKTTGTANKKRTAKPAGKARSQANKERSQANKERSQANKSIRKGRRQLSRQAKKEARRYYG